MKKATKRSKIHSKVFFRTALFVFNSVKASYFTGIKHHPGEANKPTEILFVNARQQEVSSEPTIMFFTGAWFKVSGSQKLIIKGGVGSSLIQKTSKNSAGCDEIDFGSWIFMATGYKKVGSEFEYAAYYRTKGKSINKCGPKAANADYDVGLGCSDCDPARPRLQLGPSFDKVEIVIGTSYTFTYELTNKIQKMIGVVSGFAKLNGDKDDDWPDELGAVITGVNFKENVGARLYLGNFDFTSQQHMFSDPPDPSQGVFHTEAEFYERFSNLGLMMQHNAYYILRKDTKLFGDGETSMTKHFCFKLGMGLMTYNADLKDSAEITTHIKFRIGGQNDLKFKLTLKRFKDANAGPPPIDRFDMSMEVQWDSAAATTYAPGDSSFAMNTDENLYEGSLCLGFVPSAFEPTMTKFTAYMSPRLWSRFKGKSNPKDSYFNGFDEVFSTTYPRQSNEDLTADFYLKWTCSEFTNCEVKKYYMQYYREFVGGYSGYYSKRAKDEYSAKNNDKFFRNHTIPECLQEFESGSKKECINCRREYVWHEADGACKKTDQNLMTNCRQLNLIDNSVCQKCINRPGQRGIGSPNCGSLGSCEYPDYNYYNGDRCDYCLNSRPGNHCRCNSYQNQVPHPSQVHSGKKACKCKIENCKQKIKTNDFILFCLGDHCYNSECKNARVHII